MWYIFVTTLHQQILCIVVQLPTDHYIMCNLIILRNENTMNIIHLSRIIFTYMYNYGNVRGYYPPHSDVQIANALRM